MNEFQIRTCSDSLLAPGQCCVCHEPATIAALTPDLIEHTRCEKHGHGDHLAATKPLRLAPEWDGRSL